MMRKNSRTEICTTIFIPVASSLILLLSSIYIRNKRLPKTEEKQDDVNITINEKCVKSPPYVKCSVVETNKALSTKDYPKYIYQWSKECGQIFRLNLLGIPHPVIITGDPYLVREVLNDRNSMGS